ncbi:hypothetical protein SCWH03_53340 [Streptomyces pacificus]|uniref:Uncharacterized protein n=1 Tax=Streptomyces pacificus TaxID=2705029 RepID=A0A6A0B1D4_9ACTN|nr:hypothetical protein SCWH03_53340 [Streptomyces pacificus]
MSPVIGRSARRASHRARERDSCQGSVDPAPGTRWSKWHDRVPQADGTADITRAPRSGSAGGFRTRPEPPALPREAESAHAGYGSSRGSRLPLCGGCAAGVGRAAPAGVPEQPVH